MNPIERISLELEALEIEASQKHWTQFTTGLDFGVVEAQGKIVEFLKDEAKYATVCRELEKDLPAAEKRAVFLLHKSFKVHHHSEKANELYKKIEKLENHLADVLNKHRAVLNGRETDDTQIGKIVSEDADRERRREAMLARRGINRRLADEGFLQLIELRKEHAAACGAKDFISFRLEMDELVPELFAPWKSECASRLPKLREKERQLAERFDIGEDIMPWDSAYLGNRICPQNRAKVDMGRYFNPIEKTFAAYGFKIDHLNLTYDIFPRKNKSEWGYNFTIHPGKDSRVLANVDDRFSSFGVLLHETAHGVHFLGLDPEQRLMNRGVSGIVAEGFANFFGDLVYEREFLGHVFPTDADKVAASFTELNGYKKLGYFNHIFRTLFDHELYQSDLRSLNDIHELFWRLYGEMLGRQPYADEPVWAHTIHHTCAPIYLHNYFLGDVMCEDMRRAYTRTGGEARGFGKFWMNEVLAPSGRHAFLELYDRVCGGRPDIGAFLDGNLG
jgi:hypothetical protein